MNLESDRRNKIIKYLEYHGIPNEITKGYILPYIGNIYPICDEASRISLIEKSSQEIILHDISFHLKKQYDILLPLNSYMHVQNIYIKINKVLIFEKDYKSIVIDIYMMILAP